MVLVVHPTLRGYIDGMRALDLDGMPQRQYVIHLGYEIRQGLFHAYNQIYERTVNFLSEGVKLRLVLTNHAGRRAMSYIFKK